MQPDSYYLFLCAALKNTTASIHGTSFMQQFRNFFSFSPDESVFFYVTLTQLQIWEEMQHHASPLVRKHCCSLCVCAKPVTLNLDPLGKQEKLTCQIW